MYCEQCQKSGYTPDQMVPTPSGRLIGPCCMAPQPQQQAASIFDRPVAINAAYNPQQGLNLSVQSGGIQINISKSAQEVQSWLSKYISWTQGKQSQTAAPPPAQKN